MDRFDALLELAGETLDEELRQLGDVVLAVAQRRRFTETTFRR
jgi:hypothetical protein